jgi:hypothetical protein
MLDRTRVSRKYLQSTPHSGRPPASISLGRSPYSAEHPDQRRAQLQASEAHATRVVAQHPESDLSPLSIRASQAALEERCRDHERRQLVLRLELGL